MSYEVFYGTGGHSGPFATDTDAANHALRLGEQRFVVAARSKEGISGYLPLQLYSRISATEASREGFANLLRHQIPVAFQWMYPSVIANPAEVK